MRKEVNEMTGFHTLAEIEDTMTSLASYLLVAPKKHPKQIVGEGDDTPGSSSTAKIRVTQHYVAAMLAYGMSPNLPELQRIGDWFATPFSTDSHAEINQVEMTRLEGLLNLRPDDPGVYTRIKRLIEQRDANGYFEIVREDDRDPRPIFDTLWALKVIMMARQRNVLNGLVSDEVIQYALDQIIEVGLQDKDLALALRLRHELFGELLPEQQGKLLELCEQSRKYGGLWGINYENLWMRVKSIIEAMHNRQLTPRIIDRYERDFREIIINTCYVIENLSEMVDDYPQIEPALKRSVHLWWRQFQGDNAAQILKGLFITEYNFLMVTCRTMVSMRQYLKEPLGAQFWLKPLREMSERKYSADDWQEKESVERALRQWIGIELGEPSDLKLGLSEASVIRLKPTVFNPTDEKRLDLLRESLVVKYGPLDEIRMERRNYEKLSQHMRTHFVNIPERESYVNEQQQGFIIMQDLRDYFTLFEIYPDLLKPENPPLTGMLSNFLRNIHRGNHIALQRSQSDDVFNIYLLPMLQHIDHLLRYNKRMWAGDLVPEQEVTKFQDIEHQLSDMLAKIMQYQRRMKSFPLTLMHGDLHTRNIMIRVIEETNRPWSESDLEFKLIDLESLRLDGDAAHDLGQLVVDLNLLQTSDKRSVNRSIYDKLRDLQTDLEEDYFDFARTLEDDTFALRFELAKARALIRIAKGRAKRSGKHLDAKEYQLAIDNIREGMSLADSALLYLDNVYRSLC